MLTYGIFVSAVIGLAAWQVAQPEPQPPDHSQELRHPDGSWKYTNRLAKTTSPYLLQHAHNPVEWYPWGEEAFQAAKEQGQAHLPEHRLLDVLLVPRHGARGL